MLRDPGLIPLSHDHQHALALCVLTERALADPAQNTNPRSLAEQIVRRFDSEISVHFEFEERVLFPQLAHFAATSDLVAELLAEHQRLAALIGTLRTASDPPVILEFTALLQQHVRKEERILFEQAQRLLSREQLDGIGASRAI